MRTIALYSKGYKKFTLGFVALYFFAANSFGQNQNSITYRSLAMEFSKLMPQPVVLARHGILVSPTYDSSIPQDNIDILGGFNKLLLPRLIYEPSSQKLGELYSRILNDAVWAITPLTTLQRQQLINAKHELFDQTESTPTVGYQRYLDLKKVYDQIQKKYEETPPDQIDPVLENARNQAEQDLILKGHRSQYEATETTYSSLQEQVSYKWRDSDLQALQAAVPKGQDVDLKLLSKPFPSFDDIDSINWINVSVSGEQLRDLTASPVFASSLSDTAPNWWSGFDSSNSNSASCSRNFPSGSISIKFSAGLVNLERDWFDSKVIESRAWKWKNTEKQISDGNIEGNTGEAPLFISSVLIIKDLTISGSGLASCIPAIRTATKAKNSIGFGPLSLADFPTPSSFYLAPMISRQSVRFPYIQIVGFGVNALPLAPNPNLDFLWPQP